MIYIKKLIVLLPLGFLLSACGGGGDSGGAQSSSAVSTYTFNVLQAYVNDLTTPSSRNMTVSGTLSGYAVTGSGAITSGQISNATFGSAQALQRTETVSANLTANGQTYPFNLAVTMYTGLNYSPLAISSPVEYAVIVGTPTLPTAAHVYDAGIAYNFDRYRDSTKAVYLGTGQSTYVVEADTATTAKVKFITTYKDTLSNVASVATSIYLSLIHI